MSKAFSKSFLYRNNVYYYKKKKILSLFLNITLIAFHKYIKKLICLKPQATSLQNIQSAVSNPQEPRSNSHRLLYREPFNYPGIQKKENESYIANFKKSNFHSEKTSPRNSAERREHHIISSPDSKINFYIQRLKNNHNPDEENSKLDKYKLNLDERNYEFDRDIGNFKHNQKMENFLFDKKLEKFESSPKTSDKGLGLKNETKIIKMDRNYKDLCRARRDRSPFIESAKNQIINNNSRGWQLQSVQFYRQDKVR